MQARRIKSLLFLLMLGDLLMFLASYLVAVLQAFHIILKMPLFPHSVITSIAITGATGFVLMVAYDMYRNTFYIRRMDIISNVALIAVLSAVTATSICWIADIPLMPFKVVLIAGVLQTLGISAWRISLWHVRENRHTKQRILIVGKLEEGKEITKKILLHRGHIFDIRYIYDLEKGVEGAIQLLDKIDSVLICSSVSITDSERLTFNCLKKNKSTFMIPDVFLININKSKMIQVDDVPLFMVTKFSLTVEQRFLKRAFDILISGVAIVLLSPVMLAAMAAVKATSPGPVLFKQERVTEGNRCFNVLKFRTMVNGAESKTGPVLASQGDARITKVGAFMRTTRIDELPQFFNVLLGDMSIIGPRPERPFFIEQFCRETPEFEYRTIVKAGITGLAQVLGKYTTTFEDKLRYDLMYIKNYSFMLDMTILVKTIKVVLTKDASAGLSISQSFEEFMKGNCCRVTERSDYIEISCNCHSVSPALESKDISAAARYSA